MGPHIWNIFLKFERAHECTSMNKFKRKSNLRKFVKNANKRNKNFSLKNSKVRPPGSSKTMTDSAIVYKTCFMQICFLFSEDKKYLRLGPKRGRKFGIIDTPKNFKVPPPVSPKQIEKPPIFFNCYIHRPNMWRDAKNWKLWMSQFRKIWGQNFWQGGPLSQTGGGSPFVFKPFDTISTSLSTT